MPSSPASFADLPAQPGMSMYGQLAARLRQSILDGQWQPGEALPSEASLARMHGVALGTMRQAIAVLVEDGLVMRAQGKGTFVREGIAGASMLRFFRFRGSGNGGEGSEGVPVPQSMILSRRQRLANAAEREALRLPEGARVLTLQRLRSLDGKPCLLEHIALPLPLFAPLSQGSPADWGDLLYPAYHRLCGVLVARARDEMSIVPLEDDQASRLGLAPAAPGLCVVRQAYDLSGACVEMRTTLGDAFSFAYTAEVR